MEPWRGGRTSKNQKVQIMQNESETEFIKFLQLNSSLNWHIWCCFLSGCCWLTAAATWNIGWFQFAVCCRAKHSQMIVGQRYVLAVLTIQVNTKHMNDSDLDWPLSTPPQRTTSRVPGWDSSNEYSPTPRMILMGWTLQQHVAATGRVPR